MGLRRMHLLFGVFGVVLSFLLAACQLELPPATQGRSAPLDMAFSLRANQSTAIAGEDAAIRLEPWADDKRCPAQRNCAESGPVRIQATFWRTGHPTSYPVFIAHTDQTGAVLPDAPGSDLMAKVGPYRITLTAVTPYPAAPPLPSSQAYVATFVVSKDPTANPDTDADMHVLPDHPFTLALGEQVTLTGAHVTLTVEAVTDARCAVDAGCDASQGGVVQVDLGWRKEGAAPQTITLTALTDERGAVSPPSGMVRPFRLFDGVGFRLLRVTSPSVQGVAIAPADYRVTLMLEAGPRMSTGVDYAEPGQPFALGVGYTAVIGQDVLRLRFDEVLTDSRCPRLAVCVQAGDVQLALTVSSSGQRPTSYVLGGATDSEGKLFEPPAITHDGFTVHLQQVAPYPERPDAPLTPDVYVAAFRVDTPPGLATPPPTLVAPVVTPDAARLPLLCINDFALIRRAAGANDAPVIQFTEPLPQNAATDYGQAHALCNKSYGAEWVQASPGDVERFAQFLPEGQAFWVWDGMAGSLVRYYR